MNYFLNIFFTDSKVQFRIIEGNRGGHFGIDKDTGKFRLIKKLDYEEKSEVSNMN